jgi:hypothetical protein
MSLFNFFKNESNKKNVITPILDYAAYGLSEPKANEIKFINDLFRKINETVDKHSNYIQKNNPQGVKADQNLKLKAALEISTHYWFFIIQGFKRNKVDTNIGHIIMFSFQESFQDLTGNLKEIGYEDLFFFINRRGKDLSDTISKLGNKFINFHTKNNFERIFVFEPLVDLHPADDISFGNLDPINMLKFISYFSELVSEIFDNSSELVQKYFE